MKFSVLFFLPSSASMSTDVICRYARFACSIYLPSPNSICFRFAQTRYDINPRSRSEHIECLSTYRTRKRISKIRDSGFISMRSALNGTTHMASHFSFYSPSTASRDFRMAAALPGASGLSRPYVKANSTRYVSWEVRHRL